MASLRLRGNVWWVIWGPREARKGKSTGFRAEERAKAEAVLSEIQRELKSGTKGGPLTVSEYGEKSWLPGRKKIGIRTYRDDAQRFKKWVAPFIGDKPLTEVKPSDLRLWVARLSKESPLAPRSIRHVYSLSRTLFSDAMAEGLIHASPAVLMERRKELPGKVDADPKWREGAIFQRWEAEMLMGSGAVPLDRRTLYAVLFFTGCRIGEALDLRWADYDRQRKPLGRLAVDSSYSTKERVAGDTKTTVKRFVPVHLGLSLALHSWRLAGWEWDFGRRAKPEDLLFPSPGHGGHRNGSRVLEALQEDLKVLGLKGRRIHDTRRSFISFMLADGADREWLKWITHGPPRQILEDYTDRSIPWPTLCAQVCKLELSFIEAPLAAPRRSWLGVNMGTGRGVTLERQKKLQWKKPLKSPGSQVSLSAQGGTRKRTGQHKKANASTSPAGKQTTSRRRRRIRHSRGLLNCHTVTPSKNRKKPT